MQHLLECSLCIIINIIINYIYATVKTVVLKHDCVWGLLVSRFSNFYFFGIEGWVGGVNRIQTFLDFWNFFSGDVLICKDLVFALQCQSVQRLYFDL